MGSGGELKRHQDQQEAEGPRGEGGGGLVSASPCGCNCSGCCRPPSPDACTAVLASCGPMRRGSGLMGSEFNCALL